MRCSLLSPMTLLLAGGIFVVSMGVAQRAEARGAGKRLEHLEEIADAVGVDQPTRGRIRQLIESSRAQAQALHVQIQSERRRLRELMEQDTPAESAVLAQVDKLGALKIKLKKIKMTTMLRARQLLTPAQRVALRQLREKRREELRQHCETELQQSCAKFEGQRRQSMHCLMRRFEQLSPTCRQAVIERLGEHGGRF